MLPKNKLAFKMLLKLKIYAGSEHPHQSQQPQQELGIRGNAVKVISGLQEIQMRDIEMAEAVTTLKGRADDILGTGRRKTSVARVRLRPGQGTIVINSVPSKNTSATSRTRTRCWLRWCRPASASRSISSIRVDGGGITGQADACKLGIARALKKSGEDMEKLRENALLTRDGRMKERKKYGLRGARRGTQFSKR